MRLGVVSFFLVSALVTGLCCLLGYIPTTRLAGHEAVPAMFVGCAVSWIGSLVSAIPMVLGRRVGREAVVHAVLGATVVRFLTVLFAALGVALSDVVERTPFLIWTAVSYFVLLVPDTWFQLRGSRKLPN